MSHDDPTMIKKDVRVVIRNIGLLLSGELNNPVLQGDTVVAVNGRISAMGMFKDIDTNGATTVIDAKGTAIAPGFIDSYVHPVAGDWTPRQNQLGWIDSSMHGGATPLLSPFDVHPPRKP